MNKHQVQDIVDAAIAAAIQQQQALNAAALQQQQVANAVAIQAGIAALPPAAPAGGGAVHPVQPPPAVYALTPGLSYLHQPWNYATSEGLKLYG